MYHTPFNEDCSRAQAACKGAPLGLTLDCGNSSSRSPCSPAYDAIISDNRHVQTPCKGIALVPLTCENTSTLCPEGLRRLTSLSSSTILPLVTIRRSTALLAWCNPGVIQCQAVQPSHDEQSQPMGDK